MVGPDLTVKARYEADVSSYNSAMQAAARETDKLATAADKTGRTVKGMADETAQAGTRTGRAFDGLRKNSADMQKAGGALAAVGAGLTAASVGAGKAAMDWESAFAGVKKTNDGTVEQIAQLERGLRELTAVLPASHAEIAGVAEAAGQLGVGIEDVQDFTKVMIDMGESTNMTAEQAATNFARFANIMQMPLSDVDRLGSVVVDLGNNFATTESEISDMSMRLAGVGQQMGMTEGDVMGVATAMSSVGIEAEAGGTAMSMVMKKIDKDVRAGGEGLDGWARAAGKSAEEFGAAWQSRPAEALDMLVTGLADAKGRGEDMNAILADLGVRGIRESDALIRLAGASGLLTDAIEVGNTAWEQNSALTEEASKRYETAEARIKIAWNQIKDAAIDAGGAILPVVANIAEGVGGVVGAFTDLPGPVKGAAGAIAGVGGVAALAAGSLLMLAPRAADTYDAFSRLAEKSPATASAITKVGKAAAVASAAIIGFSVLKGWANDAAPATKGLEETTNAVLRLKDAAEGDFTALDDLFSSGESIRDLGDAIRYADPSDLDSRMESFGSTVLGLETPAARAREQFDTLGKTLATMDAESAAEQFRKLREAAEAKGSTMLSTWEGVKEYMPAYAESVEAASNATGKAADEATLYGIAMGHLPSYMQPAQEATEGVATAAEDATESLGALGQVDAGSNVGGIAEAMGILTDEATELDDKLDGVLDALTRMGVLESNAISATMGYQEALEGLAAAAEENAATLDLTTEAGRANMTALKGLSDAGRDLFEANTRAHESQGTLRDGLMSTYESLVTNAEAMGQSATEADALARKLMGIPPSVDVETYLSDKALVAAQATGEAIEAIPGYRGVAIAVTEDGTVGEVQASIDQVDGKTVYMYVTTDGSKEKVQQEIREINGKQVPVWVTDDGTVVGTQEDIFAITGKNVDVSAIAHTGEAEAELDRLARTRYATVVVSEVSKAISSTKRFLGIGGNAAGGVARLPGYSAGGRLPYTGLGTDMILGVTGTGTPIARVDDGEWIINQRASKRFHGVLSAINRGDPSVKHLAGYAGGGRPGREWSANSINPVVNVNAPAAPGVDVNAIASAVVAGVAALPAPRIYMGERQLGAAVRESMNYTRR